MDDFLRWGFIALGGFFAGAVNSVAGGGTIVSFPVLVWAGIDPVAASATNSVALFPATISGTWGFQRDLIGTGRAWWLLAIPATVGGLAGAALLLAIEPVIFEVLAPWLVLGASVLLAVREGLMRHLPSTGQTTMSWVIATLVLLAVGVYAGFFGAGIGIILLATLGLLGLDDLHRMNALKNFYSAAMKGAALVWFALLGGGIVDWPAAVVMAAGSFAGAFAGARVAYRIGRDHTRRLVVAIGIALSATLLVRLVT